MVKKIIPGFTVCLLISYISSQIGNFFPKLGSASFAIIFGIILGNTVAENKIFENGAKFSESKILACSIVLLGGTLNIWSVMSIGVKGIFFIAVQMLITISVSIYFGKKMKFEKKFTYLMGAGNAVCGTSAIGAVAPVVKPKKSDLGISVTMVNLLGTMLMFILPAISKLFFQRKL